MFSLSKRTEYGLMALVYLSELKEDHWANVAEIAKASEIPKELLAKVLSKLAKAGLASSYPGPTGGFRLAKPASSMSLAEILNILDRRPGLVNCYTEHNQCNRQKTCTIRTPLARIHQKVAKVLEDTSLTDILMKQVV
ncbi:MAG: Rrf2 family transcriptional regulator [FCB group bacterium]|nr:Rrf2 family transcriptional regulator [FCB group bacterium]